MVTIRIKLQLKNGTHCEIEGTPEELAMLSDNSIKQIEKTVQSLVGIIALSPSSKIEHAPLTREIEDWVDLSGEVPHLGALVRTLSLKEQILMCLYALSLKGKKGIKLAELHEFMRNDGFPVNYGSVAARMGELVREGLLIKNQGGEYSLSKYGEEMALTIIRGEQA